jgi:hypothetical protein
VLTEVIVENMQIVSVESQVLLRIAGLCHRGITNLQVSMEELSEVDSRARILLHMNHFDLRISLLRFCNPKIFENF